MGVGVGLGLAQFPFRDSVTYWRWVDVCESGGVDSLWQTDRITSRDPILECMSAMAALAGATKRMKFGMNVASVGFRDPVLLAKQCATIDYLSNGRLLPAFGVGSVRSPDWRGTGTAMQGRGARTNEGLEIITRLWAGERLSFTGDHFAVEKAQISPLPVQTRLPLWIGGSSKFAIERTGRFGTGWQAAAETPEEIVPVVAAIRAAAAAHGRSIDADHFGTGFYARLGSWQDPIVTRTATAIQAVTGKDPRRSLVVGGVAEIVDRVKAFVDAGISKFILRPLGTDDDDIIDQTRQLIEKVMPEIPPDFPAVKP